MDTYAREDALKNIILLTDGIPQHGSTMSNGPYTSSDSLYYQYANSAYNVAKNIMGKYSIVTVLI